jgi:hypothetical protein
VDAWVSKRQCDEERHTEFRTRGVVVKQLDAATGEARVVGEVIIHAHTSIRQVREMVREELGVPWPFVLRKCHIPLPRHIDSKKACLFVSSRDEYFVVVPSQ